MLARAERKHIFPRNAGSACQVQFSCLISDIFGVKLDSNQQPDIGYSLDMFTAKTFRDHKNQNRIFPKYAITENY